MVLFGHMLIARAVQLGNLLTNSLSIKFSKLPPLPKSPPKNLPLKKPAEELGISRSGIWHGPPLVKKLSQATPFVV